MSGLISLEVCDLACVRGMRTVFRAVDFCVARGQVLSVEGPNGAGKTSLLRTIAGFLTPASGSISVATGDGRVRDSEERGKLIGWLSHQDAAKSQLTAAEQLGFFASLYRRQGDAGIRTALAEVGLTRVADLPCQYLSAGQKKRLALARLKLGARPLWLLDEPLAALDDNGKALLRTFITAHRAAGGIVLAATHDALGVECERLTLGGAK